MIALSFVLDRVILQHSYMVNRGIRLGGTRTGQFRSEVFVKVRRARKRMMALDRNTLRQDRRQRM